MRVSLAWLKELVQLTIPVDQLVERLSMAGFEVESCKDLSEQCQGVVVGFVEKTKKHPNADKLTICNVNTSLGESLQIVCGAPNIRSGIHVPVATVGSHLPAIGISIKSSKLRGEASEGMICSLKELGIAGNSEGIAVLEELSRDSSITLGQSIAEIFGIDDTLIELAITANRPDGMSMVGIAREVAALTESRLSLPKLEINPEHKTLSSSIINNSDTDLYSITLIEDLSSLKSSPDWIQKRLQVSGLRPVNAIVDITNYLMLEQGQPLHAYDADSLEKLTGEIITSDSFGVRYANDKETFNGIDGKKYLLNNSCQVVTCQNIPIALAGILGSIETQVSSSTKRIWLESAVFSQKSVRIASRNLGIRTDASSRFEKGVIIELSIPSAIRASQLLSDLLDSHIEDIWATCIPKDIDKEVILRRDAIHKLLGPFKYNDKEANTLDAKEIDQNMKISLEYISDKDIERCLTSIGCLFTMKQNNWIVKIPVYRKKDLLREVDLIEEIARLLGYDSFEASLPEPLQPGRLTPYQRQERRLRNNLCSSGMQEVTTLSLVSAEINNEKRIPLSNPLFSETSHLRTNLFEEHLRICETNLKSGQNGCWIFEIGRVFLGDINNLTEIDLLSGIISGERRNERWTTSAKVVTPNYYQARGMLDKALRAINVELSDSELRNDPILHPGRSASLHSEGQIIGRFGQIHPSQNELYNLPSSTYLFELDLRKLLRSSIRPNKWNVTFQKFPIVPSMERDIAIIVSKDSKSADIIKVIIKAGKPLLENVELIDRYEGENLAKDKCSLAFRLRYRDKINTLTDVRLQPIHDKVREALKQKFDLELRS